MVDLIALYRLMVMGGLLLRYGGLDGMALLAGVCYDPSVSVSKSTASLLAMTAFDTTNLRLTFTAPANGKVLVRINCIVHGAVTSPVILLGVLSGSTVIARQVPIGGVPSYANVATMRVPNEALFTITGLTGGSSYTWDAAYGVEILYASTAIKYGGPNDTTTDNAFGGISFEVWEAPGLLGSVLYDPSTAATKSCASLLAMTAIDTTNLRITFTAPASGKVLVRIRTLVSGSTTRPVLLLGVLDSTTVRARSAPNGGMREQSVAGSQLTREITAVVTGLTGGSSYTWDAAYGVEVIAASCPIKYGGPNDTTTNNAFGGILFEIWDAS
jgi:hypothetical protein